MQVGVHLVFLEKLVWVDDVVIVMPCPYFGKIKSFFNDVIGNSDFAHGFVF